MGITGLLGFVKNQKDPEQSAIKPGHLIAFKGKRAAVDAYSWLHKGVYTCAQDLFLGKETTRYVDYCIKNLKLLLGYNIKPILVFDGGQMPFKVVETSRKESRKRAKNQANDLIAAGKMNEAYNSMVASINVTHKMASNLIKASRKLGIDSIVAPYEADSQLAYLEQNNFVDFVITEDSDLIVYGCKNIFFKLNSDGHGEIYNRDLLEVSLKSKAVRFSNFNFIKFQRAAIMSGCDYIKNLPGIGLMKAWKFMNLTENTDIRQFLRKIPSYLKISVMVDDEYINNFIMAEFAFNYQIVFDPKLKTRIPMNTIEEENEDYKKFMACFNENLHDELQQALGNIDAKNNVYDNFDPNETTRISIFSQEEPPEIKIKSEVTSFFNCESYKNPQIKTKINEIKEEFDDSNDLMNYYSNLDLKSKNETIADVVEEPPRKKPRKCKFVRSTTEDLQISSYFKKKQNNSSEEEAENSSPIEENNDSISKFLPSTKYKVTFSSNEVRSIIEEEEDDETNTKEMESQEYYELKSKFNPFIKNKIIKEIHSDKKDENMKIERSSCSETQISNGNELKNKFNPFIKNKMSKEIFSSHSDDSDKLDKEEEKESTQSICTEVNEIINEEHCETKDNIDKETISSLTKHINEEKVDSKTEEYVAEDNELPLLICLDIEEPKSPTENIVCLDESSTSCSLKENLTSPIIKRRKIESANNSEKISPILTLKEIQNVKNSSKKKKLNVGKHQTTLLGFFKRC